MKGALFVAVTAAILFAVLRRRAGRSAAAHEAVRAVHRSIADAVLVADDARRVVDVNEAAVALFEARDRRELLVGLDALLAMAPLSYPDGRPVPGPRTTLARALSGETVTGDEFRLTRLDGRQLFVSISSAPVQDDAADQPRLAVAVVRDQSDVKSFEEAREEFFATAAHEFRTPLAVVKAHAQLMRRRRQGDPASLDSVVRQIDRLTRILEQLLEVSRFRLGGAVLSPERFDLALLVEELADRFRGQAPGRRIVVDVEAAEVAADRARIGQVVANLLDNALRFSPGGGDVEVRLASQEGLEALVSIRDQGIGIPRERQARVFERYFRAHAGTTSDHGGLGLGLGVSREIVLRHGGRIWFESEPGAGSTFHFTLPLVPGQRPAPPPRPPAEAQGAAPP